MQERLFVFGRPAQGDTFTDREKERAILKTNFRYGINTFLISPRRWGKTSLVLKVINELKDDSIITVFVDVFKCKNAEEFCEKLASAVLSQTSGRIDEVTEYLKSILSRISLGIGLSPDPFNNLSVSLNFRNKDKDFEALLQIPASIAEKKNTKILVCIDEFQQITEFEDSLSFQKLLRTVWQHQENVTYCLFGSKKHMMEGLFDDESKPFYKFGEVLYLEPIPLRYWTEFITSRFARKGKTISAETCERICELVDYNSYYVQQLSWLLFRITDIHANEELLESAMDDMIAQNSALFESKTESLTSYQMNFLRAVSDGVHDKFSSSHIISKYRLGSSANVVSLKKTLIEKDLITSSNGLVKLTDPVLGLWLKR